MQPRVTVAIPTFNRANLLAKTIRSVLNQSMDEIEVFVSDNASTDDTEAVVRSFDDRRLHYLRNSTNLGLHANLSRCLQLGRAPLVVVITDDEVMSVDNLEIKSRVLDRNHEVDLVHSGIRLNVVGADDQVLLEQIPFGAGPSDDVSAGPEIVVRLLTQRYWMYFTTLMMRRSLTVGESFNVSDGPATDLGFCLRAARKARLVAYIAEPLVTSGVHPDADSMRMGIHSFEDGSLRATFAGIKAVSHARRRFLAEFGHEMAEVAEVRAAADRRTRKALIRRVKQMSMPDRSPIVTYRLLCEAARVDRSVLFTPKAVTYLASNIAGPRGRALARRMVRSASVPSFHQ